LVAAVVLFVVCWFCVLKHIPLLLGVCLGVSGRAEPAAQFRKAAVF
jgi:hypothetical protein